MGQNDPLRSFATSVPETHFTMHSSIQRTKKIERIAVKEKNAIKIVGTVKRSAIGR